MKLMSKWHKISRDLLSTFLLTLQWYPFMVTYTVLVPNSLWIICICALHWFIMLVLDSPLQAFSYWSIFGAVRPNDGWQTQIMHVGSVPIGLKPMCVQYRSLEIRTSIKYAIRAKQTSVLCAAALVILFSLWFFWDNNLFQTHRTKHILVIHPLVEWTNK